jgi:hypothetical protein
VFEVAPGLVAGEQAQGGKVGQAPGDALELVPGEHPGQPLLAGEDDAQDEPRVHVEVGEDTDHVEGLGPEIVRLVQEQDRPEAVGPEAAVEVLLQGAHQGRVAPGRAHAAGGGDLAAHVALAEARHLHVAHAVASLGQPAPQPAQQRGLARPGRGDERGGHAPLDRAPNAVERLVEVGQRQVLALGEFAGERCLVEAE